MQWSEKPSRQTALTFPKNYKNIILEITIGVCGFIQFKRINRGKKLFLKLHIPKALIQAKLYTTFNIILGNRTPYHSTWCYYTYLFLLALHFLIGGIIQQPIKSKSYKFKRFPKSRWDAQKASR